LRASLAGLLAVVSVAAAGGSDADFLERLFDKHSSFLQEQELTTQEQMHRARMAANTQHLEEAFREEFGEEAASLLEVNGPESEELKGGGPNTAKKILAKLFNCHACSVTGQVPLLSAATGDELTHTDMNGSPNSALMRKLGGDQKVTIDMEISRAFALEWSVFPPSPFPNPMMGYTCSPNFPIWDESEGGHFIWDEKGIMQDDDIDARAASREKKGANVLSPMQRFWDRAIRKMALRVGRFFKKSFIAVVNTIWTIFRCTICTICDIVDGLAKVSNVW
jgi:hypothetical protein